MKQKKSPRQKFIQKISGAQFKEPPELCAGCVWALRESGRSVCPFARCVITEKGWPMKPK